MGDTPRTFSSPSMLGKEPSTSGSMPQSRAARNFLPSHAQVMALVMKCLPPVDPTVGTRQDYQQRFKDAMMKGTVDGEPRMCNTPLRWIGCGLGDTYVHHQIGNVEDFYAKNGTLSSYLVDIFLVDVILNRAIIPSGQDKVTDPDNVVMVRAYRNEDLHSESDHKYRTAVAFLPGAGVFYCARERRRSNNNEDVDHVKSSLIPLDMSWLRISVGENGLLEFGKDGYIRDFAVKCRQSGVVSGWRVCTNRESDKVRVIYEASQCHDYEGTRMPPDIIGPHSISLWPYADKCYEYNRRLACSNSVKSGGRHYAPGCLYSKVPEDSCLLIDSELEERHVDIVIDVSPVAGCKCRKSTVMIRRHMSGNRHGGLDDDVAKVLAYSSLLRKQTTVGGKVRASKGDVGSMYAIGTRVNMDGITTSGYSANSRLPMEYLRDVVKALARLGSFWFPDVMAVIHDTEGDSGVKPVTPMDGDGNGLRVGYTIDMSVNLGNSGHYDVHDASQGFSVWTEDQPGTATNWYFILPNVHGIRVDGTHYNGVAIRLKHGTAISWDGRVVRHCTAVPCPGKAPTSTTDEGTDNNHVYGTFTAAKERVVSVGRGNEKRKRP